MKNLFLLLVLVGVSLSAGGEPVKGGESRIPLGAYKGEIYARLKEFGAYARLEEEYSSFSDDEKPDLTRFEKKSTERLIRILEEDPYEFGYDAPAQVLVSRQSESASLLMSEMPGADGYFLVCLVNMLAEMPSAERDRVFVEKLGSLSNADDDFLRPMYVSPMLMSLAVNRAPGAAGLIRRFATNRLEEEGVRASARIALNILGEPELVKEPKFSVVMANAELDPESESCRLVVAVLSDLARHEVLAPGAFRIKSIVVEDGETSVEGQLPGDGDGTWQLVLGTTKEGKMPLYYTWHTGPLAARGFFGLVEKRDDTWLCVFWEVAWMS